MGTSYNPKIVKDGLVLCLDAANKRSYPGSGTTWTDLSGNGNSGSLTNGPTFNTGSLGNIQFDGVDDHSDHGPSLTNNLNRMTIGVVVKVNSDIPSAYEAIAAKYIGADDSGWILMRAGDGTIGFHFRNSTSTYYAVNGGVMSIGQYYYITAVREQTRSVIYMNGTLSNHTNITLGQNNVFNSSQNFKIASITDTVGGQPVYHYGPVSIGYFHVYNRDLSADEIKQNFNALRGRYGI